MTPLAWGNVRECSVAASVLVGSSSQPPYLAYVNNIEHNIDRTETRLSRIKSSRKELSNGCTLVPIKLYFNDRGIAKLELGVARGKRKADKRQDQKTRDWNREKSRLLRDKG